MWVARKPQAPVRRMRGREGVVEEVVEVGGEAIVSA